MQKHKTEQSKFLNSELGCLWIDEVNANEALSAIGDVNLSNQVKNFINDGFIIIENAISSDIIDQIVENSRAINEYPEFYVLKHQGNYLDPIGVADIKVGHRIVDLYAISEAARSAIMCKPVVNFLHEIFREKPIAMQSISFEYGSQQAIHQDTAYVVSQKPLSLAATWIALEDVEEGTGELMYYKGGHRLNHYLFSGKHKAWMPERDGTDAHKEFLAQLHCQAKEHGLQLQKFLAKKGDVLIWHADLPHGGAKICSPHTRRSLVTHFVPSTVKAHYKNIVGEKYFELEMNGGYFSSRHYDLSALDSSGRASIMYDGGVTKRRGSQV